MKFAKRFVSLSAIALFGATTAIYAANVTETGNTAEEDVIVSLHHENEDSMTEKEQLAEVELPILENAESKESETETKENVEGENTEQQKNTEEINVAGRVENVQNAPQETEAEIFDPKSLIPPGNEEEWPSQLRKYTLFYYDGVSAIQIVTKVNKDGTFIAEPLGVWLKKQDVYDISVLEEDGKYKKLLYKSRPENQQREEFEPTDDVEYLYFDMLVVPDEYLIFEGGYQEIVDEVYSDGSFTTDYISE